MNSTTPVFSLFVLHDNNTWEQPSFRILHSRPLSEHEIQMVAENHFGGFISYGLQEDPEATPECVVPIIAPGTTYYGIGIEHEPDSFGMLAGPLLSLEEVLDREGPEGSVIICFEEDKETVIYRRSDGEWGEIEES